MIEVYIPGFDISLTAQSGQCFRFHKISDTRFRVIARNEVLPIEVLGKDRFLLYCDEKSYQKIWHDYLDLSRNYLSIMKDIPPDDAFLNEALRHTSGLRVLRQEPWECLVSFIISQRKNIPAIKSCVNALARAFGETLGGDLYAFPTPEKLAGASLEELNACSLGYRSAYIKNTAEMVASGEINLESLNSLPDEKLREALQLFPGVGVKVADCVMLFSFGRTKAFPRDVWINRVIDLHYGGINPAQTLGEHAGILQQCMFCFIRSNAYTKNNHV